MNLKRLLTLAFTLAVARYVWSCPTFADTVDPNDPHMPHLMDFTPQSIFIPPGFDDNDRAQIVIAGYYPNTCYKQGPTLTAIDEPSHTIYLRHQAYHFESCWCLETTVPFQETVQVGILHAGTYQVALVNGQHESTRVGTLAVAKARTSSPDDYLYASVTQAYVSTDTARRASLTLSGTIPQDCVDAPNVQVLYRTPRIIEVLPVLTVHTDRPCQNGTKPFTSQIMLAPRWTGTTLIYIRSMNGNALSRVVDF